MPRKPELTPPTIAPMSSAEEGAIAAFMGQYKQTYEHGVGGFVDGAYPIPKNLRFADQSTLEPERQLAPNERKVVEGIIAGKSNGRIAQDMRISAETIRNYVTAMREKLTTPVSAGKPVLVVSGRVAVMYELLRRGELVLVGEEE